MLPLRLGVVTLAPPMPGLATLIFPRSSLSSRRWRGLWTEPLYRPGLFYCQGCSLPAPQPVLRRGTLALPHCVWRYIS